MAGPHFNDTNRIEQLGFIFGVVLSLLLTFTVVAPYVFTIRSPELIRQIDQTQNTIQNLCLILAGFLYGTSVGKRQLENALEANAKTTQQAVAAAAGATGGSLVIPPGTEATIAAGEDGSTVTATPPTGDTDEKPQS